MTPPMDSLPKAPKGESSPERFTPVTVTIMVVSILALVGWVISLLVMRRADYPLAFSTTLLVFASILLLHIFGVRPSKPAADMPKTKEELTTFIQQVIDAQE